MGVGFLPFTPLEGERTEYTEPYWGYSPKINSLNVAFFERDIFFPPKIVVAFLFNFEIKAIFQYI
jgi:hypothetical protein